MSTRIPQDADESEHSQWRGIVGWVLLRHRITWAVNVVSRSSVSFPKPPRSSALVRVQSEASASSALVRVPIPKRV